MSYLFNNTVELNNLDAFGRSRVSTGFKLAEYSHVYGEDSEMLFSYTGSGTYSYIQNQATVELQVGTGIGQVINQSRMYHHYQPGNSQLIFTSLNMRATASNAIKRVGYFDDQNGFFLQQTDSHVSFVERSYITSAVNNDVFTQSSWNIDKLDGTGASRYNLDFEKTQLMFIDFQWLGVGRIRCGFNINGKNIVAHEVYHSNLKETPYWSNPSLPIRYEIERTATASGTASLSAICSTVISEGGYDTAGYDYAVDTIVPKDISAGETAVVMAIRLKNSVNGYRNSITIRPGDFKVFSLFSSVKYEIWRLPSSSSLVGATWSNVVDSSVCEYTTNPLSFTTSGGDILNVGYADASKNVDKNISINNSSATSISGSVAKKTFIAQNIDSTGSNIIVIMVQPLFGATASLHAAINWREVY